MALLMTLDISLVRIGKKVESVCDRCGACCASFPVYVSAQDAETEPRIKQESLKLPDWLNDKDWQYQLHPLPFHNTCCFLGKDNLCKIYATRPCVCRKFEAGSPQCEEARKRKGLASLQIALPIIQDQSPRL